MNSPDRLLTVDQAAERLAIGRVKLYELIRDGALVSVRIGRARRVPESAVEAFIADRAERAPVGGAA